MITRKAKGKGRRAAAKYLETLMGGPLTLGAALSGLREADEQSLAEYAKLLGVSRTHLCDIEQGRRAVSPERAARFAHALGQSEAQFVRLALQDQIRSAGLKLTVEVSGERTPKVVVTKALQEFIARREQRRVADLMGKLEWDASFDYKSERSRKGVHGRQCLHRQLRGLPLMAMHHPPHPGEFIQSTYMEPFGVSCWSLAEHLNVAASTLNRILKLQSGVSPEMALRLSKVLGPLARELARHAGRL